MGASAAIGLMVAGGVTSASGQYASGKANQELANYNARIADVQAEDALARGRESESIQRKRTKALIGTQRARFGAQNIEINDGSALDVQADTAYLGELDALTIRNNAAREAWGYKVQAEDYRARGRIARMEGTYGAAGTLLGGFAKAAQPTPKGGK